MNILKINLVSSSRKYKNICSVVVNNVMLVSSSENRSFATSTNKDHLPFLKNYFHGKRSKVLYERK